MTNKKTAYVFVLILTVILFFSLSCFRYYNLNLKYPDFRIFEHSIGEEIRGGDISIIATSCELLDGKQTKLVQPNYEIDVRDQDGTFLDDDQVRNLIIHIKVINNTNIKQVISFVNFYPESGAWTNGLSLELYRLYNPYAGSPIEYNIDPNSTNEIVLPYTMIYSQFKDGDWRKIEQRTFQLVLSQYPVKHIINLC